MKGLFVGARVRIKWSRGWPELKGQEGRIMGVSLSRGIGGDSEWFVAPDCWGTVIAPRPGLNGGAMFGPSSSQLEPILPDGHQAGTMSYKELMDSLSLARAKANCQPNARR